VHDEFIQAAVFYHSVEFW